MIFHIIAIIIFLFGIIIPFIKPRIFKPFVCDMEDSDRTYTNAIEDAFGLLFIKLYMYGSEDNSDSILFIFSYIVYVIIVGIISLIWMIILPCVIIFFIIKTILKRRNNIN